MSKQSTSRLPKVSPEKNFRRKLRTGQQDLYEFLIDENPDRVNVQWPGGYGKSLGIALAFRAMLIKNRCNRLLIVVANDTQKRQILNDFKQDCLDVALKIPGVFPVSPEPNLFRAHKENAHCVFVTTIQQIESSDRHGTGLLKQFVGYQNRENKKEKYKWMLACDEYHHYADDMAWGEALRPLANLAKFCMATSATPERDGNNTIFGPPNEELIVTYEEAKNAGCLKKMSRKSYEYRIDAVLPDGELLQISTYDILHKTPEAEKLTSLSKTKTAMRLSAKYVLPLISRPATRLLNNRDKYGVPLQMLIRAMSCSHAQNICEMLKPMFDSSEGLTVDWVGTGDDGRTKEKNRSIISAFCPPKDSSGNRPEPKLDILVQVGMAGEGFDSILVSEIVDLSLVLLSGKANDTKQFYLRGSRFVKNGVPLYINVPQDHPLLKVDDKRLLDWIDGNIDIEEAVEMSSQPAGVMSSDDDYDFYFPDSLITGDEIADIELTAVTEMDIVKMKTAFTEVYGQKFSVDNISDEEFRSMFLKMHKINAEEKQQPLTLQGQRKEIDKLAGKVARLAVVKNHGEFERSMLADYKKRINSKLRRDFGPRDAMLENELERAFDFLKSMYGLLKNGGRVSWL